MTIRNMPYPAMAIANISSIKGHKRNSYKKIPNIVYKTINMAKNTAPIILF